MCTAVAMVLRVSEKSAERRHADQTHEDVIRGKDVRCPFERECPALVVYLPTFIGGPVLLAQLRSSCGQSTSPSNGW